MNWPHVHLMLNHAPVLGVLLALALLLIGMFRDRSSLKEAAFITLVLTGALAAIVYYTGDAAGELLGACRRSAKLTSSPTAPWRYMLWPEP